MKRTFKYGLIAMLGLMIGSVTKIFAATTYYLGSANCSAYATSGTTKIAHSNAYVYNTDTTSGQYVICPAHASVSYSNDPSTTSAAHAAYVHDGTSSDAVSCTLTFGDNVNNYWQQAWVYTCTGGGNGCSTPTNSFTGDQELDITNSTSGQTNVSTFIRCWLPTSGTDTSRVYGYRIALD